MNYFELLLAFILTATTSIAADKAPIASKANDVLAVSTQKTKVKPWKPTAFVQKGERLPVGYTGIDPIKFYLMFKSKVDKIKKGEFETSEEFAQRTANKDALLTPINTSNLYAFRIDNINTKYNADTQVFEIDFHCGKEGSFLFNDSGHWVTCTVAHFSSQTDIYTGSNAYGASVKVKRYRGKSFSLAISEDNSLLKTTLSFEYDNYHDKLSIPLNKARNLKNTKVAVLFVGQVIDAKIEKARGLIIEPTINKPEDTFVTNEAIPFDLQKIIYYVIQTGEILDQKEAKKIDFDYDDYLNEMGNS